jgi:hypothetical protein
LRPSLTCRTLLSAALALGVILLTGTAAVASPPGWTPHSKDGRAVAYADNVTTCAAAGLSGETVTWPNLEDPTGTYVTITAGDVPSGDTLVAVVVKGGPGYNVYQGLTAWTNLQSPDNVGGQIPTISHWFACVKPSDTDSSTAATAPSSGATSTISRAPATAGSGTTGTTGGAAGGGTAPETTSGAAVAATTTATGPGVKNLAYTGFGGSWLIWVGVVLVLAGVGAVIWPRLRRRSS